MYVANRTQFVGVLFICCFKQPRILTVAEEENDVCLVTVCPSELKTCSLF